MPAKPRWVMHIGDIVTALERVEVPIVDRAMVEALFAVRRRQAIELMRRFGGYRSGNTVLLDRTALISQLSAVQASQDIQFEICRKQRLAHRLDQLRRHRSAAHVAIAVAQDVHSRRMRDLPPV